MRNRRPYIRGVSALPQSPAAAPSGNNEDQTLIDRLARWSRVSPEARAFAFLRSDGSERDSLTFAQLWRHSASLAEGLTGFIAPGDRAILAFNSEQEFIEAFLACQIAGFIAVPASLPRYKQGADRLAAIASHAGACTLLTGAVTLDSLQRALGGASDSSKLRIVATSSVQRLQPRNFARAQAGDVALIQYTSGSTGTPKGIVLTHGNLMHNQAFIEKAFGHDSKTIFAGILPLFHDMGLIGNVLQPLYLGIPCVLISPAAFLRRPACWLEAISRYGVTTSGGPNFLFDLCVDRIANDELAGVDLSTWSVAFNGAEHVSASTLERFEERFREFGFRNSAFYPCYGLAEATLIVSGGPPHTPPVIRSVDRDALRKNRVKGPKTGKIRLVSCGLAAARDSVRIVDRQKAQALGATAVGEIWVRSGSVAIGYWNDPLATAETFAGRLAGETDTYLRTGDLGFLDSGGALFVTGRCKDLIIVHGQNIHPHDVEETVSAVDSGLGRAAAFQVHSDAVQTVILMEASHAASRKFADPDAAASVFKKVRAAIYQAHGITVDIAAIVAVGSLPRTTSGKLRRHAAAAAWEAGTLKVIARERVETGGEGKGTVAAVLAAALGIDEGELEEWLPLVTRGVDSLRAAALADTLEKNGIVCPAAVLLAADTLAEISRACSPVRIDASRAVAGESEDLPLTEWQQPFWFAQAARPTSASNNVKLAVTVRGEFDTPIWSQAVRAIMDRHDALRVTISNSADDVPRQRIGGPAGETTVIVDATNWSEAQIEHRIANTVNAPFDLARAPLFRSEVLHTGCGNVLVFVAHHVVIDLWSMATIFNEAVEEYNARRDGRPSVAAPSPRLRDFLKSNEAALRRTREADLSYWLNALSGEHEALDLPLDRPAQRHASETGSRVPFEIDGADLASLQRLCARSGVTLHTALLSIYRILLYRYTAQTSVLIGTPLARRSGADKGLVGCLVNPVAVRCRIDGRSSYADILTEVREAMLGALRHGDVAFHVVVREIGAGRADRQTALLQTMFALQKVTMMSDAAPLMVGASEPVVIGGLELVGCPFRRVEVPFDLALMIAEGCDRLWGCFEYRTAVLDERTVEQAARHFRRLLHQVVEQPESPISCLDMLDADDRSLLERLQRGRRDLAPAPSCVHWLVEEQANRTPDAVAVRWMQRDVTYRELQVQARGIAAALRRDGVVREDRIGVAMQPSADWIVAMLAVWQAGATLVSLDIATPPDRMRDILRDTGLKALICGDHAPAALADAPSGLLRKWSDLRDSEASVVELDRDEFDPQRLAYIAFTSGSAGMPKGVMITHEGASNFAIGQAARIERAAFQRVLQIAPASFDASFSDVFMSLTTGGTLCIAPSNARIPGREFSHFIRAERITLITATPSALATLEPEDYPDLTAVISMGETCTVESARQWSRFCAFYNGYGPTEGSIGATLGKFEPSAITRSGTLCIGEPFANYDVYVLDADLNQVPVGVPGELFVGGPGVARGYINHADWTAERFVPNPFGQPGDRMYRTADRARWLADGGLEFLGRVDRQVKVRGVRIEPAEIEMVLRAHPMVRDCYVDAAPDGNGAKHLVAYVVGPAQNDIGDLIGFLRGRFPPFMMPARFVCLSEIPVRPNGKVDRAKLPPPDVARAAAIPATGLAARLCTAWSEVLGFPVAGIDDNFFDLGGHSLLLHRLQSAVERHTGCTVALLEFFDHPTIRTLALHLSGSAAQPRNAPSSERGVFQSTAGRSPIAIIGMAGRFPGAPDIETFWRNIVAGRESITFFSAEELAAAGVHSPDLLFVPARGVVDGVEYFDAQFFGFSQREAEILDPQKRILLELAQISLDDAGYAPSDQSAQNDVGVFVGTSRNSYFPNNVATHQDILESLGQLKIGIASDPGFAATLIAYKLDLSGPCLNVDTACSTSLVAVHQACQSLWAGECRIALAGGASIDVPTAGGHRFEEGLIASPDGHCRAFDAMAGGTVKGMGAGLVVLKRLDAALNDGDHIYAVIRASAVNNDGARKIGFTAPSAEGQAMVIRRALAAAEITGDTLGYIEAHGTGTALGDPIEVAALNRALQGAPTESIAIGSVKSNIGHLDAASGVAGLIKCVLVVSRALIPPQVHMREPNPNIDWAAGPLYVPTQMRDWRVSDGPRRAGVSSFGIGGTNAHVVLEEAPAMPSHGGGGGPWLVPLSANSAVSLRAAAGELANALRDGRADMADVAFTLAAGRRRLSWRTSLVCDGIDALAEYLTGGRWEPVAAESSPPLVVFVFPGEGTAIDGRVLARMVRDAPAFAAAVEECRTVLDPVLAAELQAIFRPGEGDRHMIGPRLAYPATFAIEYAFWSFLRASGVRADALVGRGIGELVALCAAGGVSLEDGVHLASEWGRLAETCPAGAMLAVADAASAVATMLQPGVAVAAIDGPSDCTLSGELDAISHQEDVLRRASRSTTRLAADRAFHSALMSPVCAPLSACAERIRWSKPHIPVCSAATGDWLCEPDAAYWTKVVCREQRFGDALTRAVGTASAIAIEVGPSPLLLNVLRRHPMFSKSKAHALAPRAGSTNAYAHALQALGRIWEIGVPVDLNAVVPCARRISLPGVSFDRIRVWLDPVSPPSAPAHRVEEPRADASEYVVAEIWKKFLGATSVAPDDDFFSLGGDSLLAIELSTALGERLGVKLPPRILFEHSSFRGLCDHVASVSNPGRPIAPETVAFTAQDRRLPLSTQQRGLWLASQIERAGASLNLSVGLRFEGPLDVEALQTALRALVARHPIMLHNFDLGREDGGQWRAHDPAELVVAVESADVAEWDGIVRRQANTPFSVSTDLLIRAALLIDGAQDRMLVVTLHHLVSDGWSLLVMLRDLAVLYADPMAALPRAESYTDYIAAQIRATEQDGVQSDHWQARLRDLPTVELPTDRSWPANSDDVGESLSLTINPALSQLVRAACRDHNRTLFNHLLAAFEITVRRFIEDDDVIVASPMMNRNATSHRDTVGPFVNLAIFRNRVRMDQTLFDVATAVRGDVAAALDPSGAPLEDVLMDCGLYRSNRDESPFRIAFALNHAAPVSVRFGPATTAQPFMPERQRARHRVMMWVDEVGTDIRCTLEYRPAFYDETTIRRYMNAFERVLETVTRNPSLPIGNIDILSDADRKSIQEWNNTAADRPSWNFVQHEISRVAAFNPRASAISCEGRVVDYGTLDAEARRIARVLLKKGIAVEEPVGIFLHRGIECVIAALGVLYAGGCYLPLDPELPAIRIRQMIEFGAVRCVISGGQTLGAADVAVPIDFAEEPEDGAAPIDLPLTVHPRNIAYVLFTSGSTGRPKGVMVDHRALANRLDWMIEKFGFNRSDRILHKTPISFDVSVWEIFASLTVGATMVVARPGGQRDPAYLNALIVGESVTIVHFVPSLLQVFLDHPLAEAPSLRLVICSGEVLRTDVYERASAWLGDRRKTVNLYGPTEAAIDVTAWINEEDCRDVSVSIGRPIQNIRIHILDHQFRAVPVGATGELYIAGVGLARGYIGAPHLTAERFVPDPFSSEGVLYRTGDRARWTASGNIEYLGRADLQIKLRGMRIEPGEIEAVLRANASVEDVAVTVAGAEGHERLIAHVVPDRGEHSALHSALRLAEASRKDGLATEALPNGRLIVTDGSDKERQFIAAFEKSIALRGGWLPRVKGGSVVIDAGNGGGLFGACVASASRASAVLISQDDPVAARRNAVGYDHRSEVVALTGTEPLTDICAREGLRDIGLIRVGPDLEPTGFLASLDRDVLSNTVSIEVEFATDTCAEGVKQFLEANGYRVSLASSDAGCLVTGRRDGAAADLPAAGNAEADGGVLKDSLRVYAAARLPRYMVPDEIVLIDRIPVTQSGKLDRAALAAADPWTTRGARRTAPSSPMEVKLAHIWKEVLDGEEPSFERDFFQSGGNSLLAVRLVAAIQRELGFGVDLQQLFEHPTFGQLAIELESATPASGRLIVTPQPSKRFEPFPMTEVQQAYVIGRSAAFQLGNVSTHGYLETDARGVDRQRFVGALNRLIQRHDMLRATVRGEGTLEVLAEVERYEPAFTDLRYASPQEAESALEHIRSEMANAVFDLEKWPLFDVRLTQVADDLHVVHIAIDAVIVDGASVILLEREFNRLYLDQSDAPLPVAHVTYRDFAIARSAQRSGEVYKKARAYWMRRLEGLPEAPKLPLRAPLGAIRAPQFRRAQALLDAGEWRALQKRAHSLGITAAAILIAAYAEALAKWSGEEHFLINLPIANRPPVHPDIYEIVGNFTSTVLLEVDLRGANGFEDAARRIHRRLWADLAHSDFDGVELQRLRSRQLRTFAEARTPIVFTGLLGLAQESERGGKKPFDLGREIAGVSRTSQVLLDCIAVDRPEGLVLNWDHVVEAFPYGMIGEMFDAYVKRLRGLALNDAQWRTPLFAAPPSWRALQLGIALGGLETGTLLGPVLEAASRFADRVAVVSGRVELSYEDLRTLAGGVAARLRDMGMRRGEVVAIYAEKGWEQVVAALGILIAGGAYVPVEMNLPSERRRQILNESGARLVVTQPQLADSVTDSGLATLVVARDGPRDTSMAEEVGPRDLAYLIFTSGSTGRPRGVAIEHGAAANTVCDINRRFGITAEDAVLCISGLGFDLSVYDLFGLLAAGGKLVFPDADRLFDADHWWQLVERHRVTLWNTTPLLAAHFMAQAANWPPGATASLRLFLLSGDWIPLDLADRIRNAVPGAQVVSLGGATEAAIWSIFHPIGVIEGEWKSIPYGRPLSGQDVVVLDRNLEHCPTWVTGNIHIAGFGLAREYWNEPELTANTFIEHPRWQARLYRTGDLGRYLPDGNIEFLGRNDGQVKLHGVRLELGEVESDIESRGGVDRAVVLADRQGGRDVQRLIAYVSLTGDAVQAGAAREIKADADVCEETWQLILAAQAVAVDDEKMEVDPETFAPLARNLEGQYRAAIVKLFAGFDRFAVPGSRVTLDELIHEQGIATRYRRWLARALSYLAEAGCIKRLSVDAYEVLSTVARLRDASIAVPDIALDKVLREDIHSAQLYAAADTAASYQTYYHSCHQIATAIMAKRARASGIQPLRVLEVGAGYGSLTEHVLPVLRAHDAYAFTDVSNFFLSRAAERFAQYGFVTFDHFDIDVDPQLQGHKRHSCDVVVAASVLHNAHDIPKVLAGLRSALTPGGILLLIEETSFFPFFDLGMGLQQGFDAFDDHLRRDHPLLSRDGWRRAFAEAGFARSAVLNRAGTVEDAIGFDVLVAQAPETVTLLDVAEMERHVEQFLQRSAAPSAWIQVDEFRRTANGKIDRRSLSLPRHSRDSERQTYVAPRSETERTLADIWCNAMGLTRVGVLDDFFNIGGDSLVASRVAAEVRNRLGLDLQLRALFEATTIESLAALIDTVARRCVQPIPDGFVAGEL